MIDELKKAFMHSWTGGASGAPNRFHGPGAFDNFKFADLFDNNKWTREQMIDPHTGEPMFRRSGEPLYTNYYRAGQEAYGGDPSVIADAAPVDPGLDIDVSAGRIPINSRSIPRGLPPIFTRPIQPRGAPPRMRRGLLPPSQRQATPRLGVGRTRPPMLPPSQRQAIPRLPSSTRPLLPPRGSVAGRPSVPPRPLLPPSGKTVAGRPSVPTRPLLPPTGGAIASRPSVPQSSGPVLQRNVPRGVNRGAYPNVNVANQSAKNLIGDLAKAGRVASMVTNPLGLLTGGLLWSEGLSADQGTPQYYPDSGMESFYMGEDYKPSNGLGPNAKRVTTETPDGKKKIVTTEEINPLADQQAIGMETAPSIPYIPEASEIAQAQAQQAAVDEFNRQQDFMAAEQYAQDNPYYGEERLLPEIPWDAIGDGLGQFRDDVIQGNPLIKKILGWWD